MSNTITTTAPVAPADTEILNNGDELVNEMIAASGRRNVAALKRATGSKGDRVQYTPRGWTVSGQVD